MRQNIESLGLALLVALVIRATVVEAFWVPSGSMLPTIQIGDHLFINKLAYSFHVDIPFTSIVLPVKQRSAPSRGDNVVFLSPSDGNRDESLDSRYWGFADQDKIKGKATFIYWSGWKFDRLGKFLR